MDVVFLKFRLDLFVGVFKELLLFEDHFSDFNIKIFSGTFETLCFLVFNFDHALEVGHAHPEKFIEVVGVNA